MRFFEALSDFAVRQPLVYLLGCFALGTTIRWYWVGQDLARFIDPLAPIFR